MLIDGGRKVTESPFKQHLTMKMVEGFGVWVAKIETASETVVLWIKKSLFLTT